MDEGTPQINNLGTMQGANFGDHNTYHQYFGPDGTPARAVPPDHLWTVPYLRNPLFTGREEVIRELHEQLTASRTAALAQAMSGLGGIGKTQTAVEYAYRYQTDYHHILWLRASTREEIIEDLTSLARLLQLPAQQAQDQQQIVNATRNWLQTHSGWLLIVDNADDLEMASDYLPTGSSGHILLTTRAHAMKGLAHKVELTTMPLDEGVLFLVHRAGLLAPPATLDHVSAAQREIAEAIVQALGHLPLALDQAGAYLEETGESLTSYLTLYREQRKAVLAYRGGLSTRHAPVATTWSL